MRKHQLPGFLEGKVEPEAYARWLKRKASNHAKRDQKRFGWKSGAEYRDAIHAAVIASQGKDAYTGEDLDWTLLSKYSNEESKSGRHKYQSSFALLPTVDHIEADNPIAAFKICAWRTNDSKHALTHELFVEVCKRVLEHNGYKVIKSEDAQSAHAGKPARRCPKDYRLGRFSLIALPDAAQNRYWSDTVV